jgi:hypothetical protein
MSAGFCNDEHVEMSNEITMDDGDASITPCGKCLWRGGLCRHGEVNLMHRNPEYRFWMAAWGRDERNAQQI